MKILQIFGAVVAVHLLAFIFIFASPGCNSGPRNVPTPDATMPAESSPAPVTFNANITPQPVDLGTAPAYNPAGSSGRPAPTRPGSPAAAAVSAAHVTEDVAPVSTYTIVKGDSLWSVAKKNHLPVAELAKANKIPTGAALKPGNKLIIPGKLAAPVAPAPAAVSVKATAPASDAMKYTVLPGESLGVIAHKHQVPIGELLAVNSITDPSKVRAGQQLIIPGMKASATKPAAPVTSRPTTPPKSSVPASSTAAAPAPAPAAQRFEITAPPPGQDLDAGLKEPNAEVPTIKVEDSAGGTK